MKQPPAGEKRPAAVKKSIAWSVPPLFSRGLFAAFFLFLAWYWAVQYRDLVYLTHYYDVPRWSYLLTPGGGVHFLGALPSLLAARCSIPAGAMLIVFYGASLALGLLPFITTRRESPWRLFAILPTAVMMVLVSLQGYCHFAVIRTSMFYGAFAAPALALFAAWLIGKISRTSVRLAAGGVASALCYLLFGAYGAFLTLGLIAGELGRLGARRAVRALLPAVFLLFFAAVWYFLCAGHFRIDAVAAAGLVRFYEGITDPFTMQISSRLYIAFLALAASPLLLALARGAVGAAKDAPPQDRAKDPPQEAPASGGGAAGSVLSAVVLSLVCLAVQWGSKTDENYLALLAMVRPLEYDRWEEILEIESRCESPTLPLIDLRRLALAETGQIGQRLFERPNIPVTAPDLVCTEGVRLLGTDLYFRTGSVNHAICFLCNTLRLFPEAPALRWLLFQCAMANGEFPLARKYLSLLEPMRRPDWLKAGRDLLQAAEHGTEPASDQGRRLHRRIVNARDRRPTEYILHEGSVSKNIQFSAMYSDFPSCTLAHQELILSELLLLGNIPLFEKQFPVYYRRLTEENPNASIPRALQQAVIYTDYAATRSFPLTKYRYDAEQLQRFADFMRLQSQFEKGGGRDMRLFFELEERFSDTFWFYLLVMSQAPDY
ncbi:MAG: hypothetical protein IKF77_05925 [Thermoguttaceae bacterium]|nr:hypothetical protein [Thermoguttaceae bacterium]